MRKRLIGLAILLLSAWGCSSAPPPEEPAQWSAIKFVPEEDQETARDPEKSPRPR
jgi:hypothetical protein